MTIAVVIPWRGGQPDRERHHAAVRAHLVALLPDAIHLDADSGYVPFNRAASRNLGMRLAEEAGADVAVICDADTLAEPEPLHVAIAAAGDGRLHLPYTLFRGLSAHGSEQHLAGRPAAACQASIVSEWSTGGVLVITPGAYWQAGGQDERFIGWGMEDAAFRIACDGILGPTVKHAGVITHLWHPTEVAPATEQYQRNFSLVCYYTDAEGNPEAVRKVIAERVGAMAAGDA